MVESFEEGGKEPEGVVAADDMMGTQVETRKAERAMPQEEQVLGVSQQPELDVEGIMTQEDEERSLPALNSAAPTVCESKGAAPIMATTI